MEIGLCSISAREEPLAEVMAAASRVGYDGVLELEFTSAETEYKKGLSADLEALRRMIDRYEL